MRVPEGGGAPAQLTALDESRREVNHSTPTFLPDGRHFLYYRFAGAETDGFYLGSLDSKPNQQDARRLAVSDSTAVYANGYVVFTREGRLMAQPFDASKLVLDGEAVSVAEGLPGKGAPSFSVSTTGVLVYRAGPGGRRLTWFDRDGKPIGATGSPGAYNSVSLSPDGTRAAVDRAGENNTEIWLHEFERGTNVRFAAGPEQYAAPVWSRDGNWIVFSSLRNGGATLYRKPSNNASKEEPVAEVQRIQIPLRLVPRRALPAVFSLGKRSP
jgi:dipeptidyl aminopeptidase/acylaminoacyl peptidase